VFVEVFEHEVADVASVDHQALAVRGEGIYGVSWGFWMIRDVFD
jgi:hypothetical protein